MPKPLPMSMPKPPIKPDLAAMHKWMLDMYNFHQHVTLNGLQSPFLADEDIKALTHTSQSGKIFFNDKSGKFNGGVIENEQLVVRQFVMEPLDEV